MEFIKPGTKLDFVGKRKIAFSISGALILISILALFVKGPRFGIDFAGGSVIQVKFAASVEIAKIKEGLQSIDIENATVQNMGKTYEEIAEITDCNLGTVKSRLNRARARFAQIVAPHMD